MRTELQDLVFFALPVTKTYKDGGDPKLTLSPSSVLEIANALTERNPELLIGEVRPALIKYSLLLRLDV